MARKKKGKAEPSLERWAVRRVLLFALIALVLFFGGRAFYHFLINWNAVLHKTYKALQIGTSMSEVEREMGSPVRRGEYRLEVPSVPDYDEIVKRAQKSGVVKYLYYENGISTIYALGFDRRGELVFKVSVSP